MAETRSKLAVTRMRKSPSKRSAGLGKRATTAAKKHTEPWRSALVGESGEKPSKSVGWHKVIRDSFTMPVADYELIRVLKKRCIGLGIAIKKSELLRAGLTVLDQLPSERLAQVVGSVESIKTGRPPGANKKRKKKAKKNRRTN